MKRKVFLPFHAPSIGQDEIDAVVDTLKSGWITTGPKVSQFEKDFASYIGCNHAIALNSCTSALHLALLAAGVHEGDEVITTPYTFVASAEVILWLGAKPVFVDIDAHTLNVNPESIRKALTPKTKAIIPVHLAGHPCEMDDIMGIASENSITVIEDAAHALGAQYKGKMVGAIGHMTAFSFYATKNITTGEGGMLTTDNDAYAEKIRKLSLHGLSRDAWKRYSSLGSWFYEVQELGYKYNMPDILAAIGIQQLKKLGDFQVVGRRYAALYNDAFHNIPQLAVPTVSEHISHAWHLYILRLNIDMLEINRAEFIEELRDRNIGASVHFIPLHLHPYYARKYGYTPDDFPNAKREYERVISLPLYPGMSENDVQDVIDTVKLIVAKYSR